MSNFPTFSILLYHLSVLLLSPLALVLHLLASQLAAGITPANCHIAQLLLHSMDAHQRAAIEELKQEKTKFVQLLAELQAQKNGIPAACAQQQQQEALRLQQLTNNYRHKAQEEQQLLQQMKQELHKARQQMESQRKQHSMSVAAAQQGVPAAKCCTLQERLSHKKQQLDEAVSRNKALRNEVDDLSKQGTAAQQLHDKLKRQLADAASELAQLHQLVDATEQAQQQAAALAEQLRLHNDAEDLAVCEAEKQLQAWMLTQQQTSICEQQPALHEQDMHCGAHRAHGLAEVAAANVLEQLLRVYVAAGAPISCPASNAGEQANGSRWSALLQQVQQLQASNAEQFRQCILANHQLRQLQEAPHAPQG